MDAQVLINGRALGRRITGVERYTREVSARLGIPLRTAGIHAPQGFRGHIWEQVFLPQQISKHEILWSPANSGPLAVSRQVLTIHDLSVVDHPEWFNPRFAIWYRWLLPRLAHRVKLIITDSLYSKIRISRAFRISADKIHVVPCGVDAEKFYPRPDVERARLRRKYSLPPAYMLFVGTLEPRKNLPTLVHAWAQVFREVRPVHLVIAGGPGDAFRRLSHLEAPADGVLQVGYVSDADLPALYSAALGFVMPSLYEGFGLPILEAMACGTPVIAGRAAALPEVVGESGLLIDPLSVPDLAAALRCLVQDDELRRDLARKGYERSRLYTWDRSARLVRQALQQAGAA